MVTSKEGILTSNNVGAFAATGGTGERVLVDYKDALQDYKTTDIPALQLFTETMTTDTGGDIDLTFAMPSRNMERREEGSTNVRIQRELVPKLFWIIHRIDIPLDQTGVSNHRISRTLQKQSGHSNCPEFLLLFVVGFLAF